MNRVRTLLGVAGTVLLGLAAVPGQAQVQEYGDEDLLGLGSYGSDPKAGATLTGLTAGTITDATNSFGHGFPFSPSGGEFAGTDQIYAGSGQTASHDGYASFGSRLNGPQVFTLNYGALIPVGQTVQTLTLGIAADDFQQPAFGQPYVATLNGGAATALTGKLNSLNETGPVVHFFTIGVDTSILTGSNTLTFSIDQGGDGGDGWAVDFLTVGVTTSPTATPEPSTIALFITSMGSGAAFLARRKRVRRVS